MSQVVQKIAILFFLPAAVFLIGIENVSANAWWGYGSRDKDWVLAHEGTIVKCEIDNHQGDSSEYKMVMYDDDDHYVEKEFGIKVIFDDAKKGDYKISAYRGGTEDRTTYKGGKKFASIEFTAHPGETIKIEFDYKKRKAEMTTDYVEPSSKPLITKPLVKKDSISTPEYLQPDADISENVSNAENPEASQISEAPVTVASSEASQTQEEASEQEKNLDWFRMIDNIFHPDAQAMENGIYSDQVLGEEYESVLKAMWDAIVKFFTPIS